MKKQLLLLIIILSFIQVSAQQKVALHSQARIQIFGGKSPFIDAYNNASNGDTIYLPAGKFSAPDTINKGIVIFGVGHYPDTIMKNYTTSISGINLLEGANNLYIEGVAFTGEITFSENERIDNITFKRCLIKDIKSIGDLSTPCEHLNIIQSVITGNIDFSNITSSSVMNNIIAGKITNGINIGIINNVFLYDHNYSTINYTLFSNIHNCYIANNIIRRSKSLGIIRESSHNMIESNIFSINPPEDNNTFEDNWVVEDVSSLFFNQTGTVFNYEHDYHLSNPEMYLCSDNKEAGIYGGPYPYKEKAIPQIPRIKFQNISRQTNEDGTLNIQIEVEAQNN